MAELSGFSTVQKATPDLAPQALAIPTSKTEAIEKASAILEGLWGAVEAGLSNNIRIEILKHPEGYVYCIVAPLQPNAVDQPVANPGDHLVVDGIRLTPMTSDVYATLFVPAEQILNGGK